MALPAWESVAVRQPPDCAEAAAAAYLQPDCGEVAAAHLPPDCVEEAAAVLLPPGCTKAVKLYLLQGCGDKTLRMAAKLPSPAMRPEGAPMLPLSKPLHLLIAWG